MKKRFLLIPIAILAMLGAAAPVASAATPVHLHNRQNQSKCLGIRPSDAFGVIWDCLNHPDQLWHAGANNPSDSRFAQFVNNDGLCLGVSGGSLTKGTQIRAGRCDLTHRDQFWAPAFAANCALTTNPWAYIVNFNSGWIIGVKGGNLTNGTQLVQWSMDCHPDQVWAPGA